MLNLGRISNSDPVIDEKVKFFHDYYHYFLLDNAKKIEGFPENHLTYLEKILIRLEFITKMTPSIREVIKLWLEEPEFDTAKDEFSKKEEIKPLVLYLKDQIRNTKTFDVYTFKNKCNQIITSINGNDGLIAKIYFNDLLKSQILMLQCPHGLDYHKNEIIRNTKWMIAEFLRHGFDGKELSGLDGIFRRLMKFGQLKGKENARKVDFPLPEDLRRKVDSPDFEAELENYLGGNHFKTQFDGMFNVLSEEKRADIYFKISAIDIDQTVSFEFNNHNCTIFTIDRFPIKSIKCDQRIKTEIKNYFVEKNSLIAKVTLDVKSVSKSILRSSYLISRSLEALRYYLGRNGGILNNSKILFLYYDGGYRLNSNRESQLEIGMNDVSFIERSMNAIPLPDNLSKENRRYLDRNNRIFFKGLSCTEPNDIITHFWQYWESAFYFHFSEGKGNGKGDKIINDLAIILAKEKGRDMKIDLGFLLYTYAMNNCERNTFGIDPEFYTKRRLSSIPDELDEIVSEIEKSTRYPFLVCLIERYNSIDESCDHKWHRFYTKLFWQLYEQRNSIHHDGTYCEATLEQLMFFFRNTVVRWQNKLFTEMELTPELGIKDIILNMKKKSITKK